MTELERSGRRSQIVVDTPARRIEVWRDADPAFRVELRVAAQNDRFERATVEVEATEGRRSRPTEN